MLYVAESSGAVFDRRMKALGRLPSVYEGVLAEAGAASPMKRGLGRPPRAPPRGMRVRGRRRSRKRGRRGLPPRGSADAVKQLYWAKQALEAPGARGRRARSNTTRGRNPGRPRRAQARPGDGGRSGVHPRARAVGGAHEPRPRIGGCAPPPHSARVARARRAGLPRVRRHVVRHGDRQSRRGGELGRRARRLNSQLAAAQGHAADGRRPARLRGRPQGRCGRAERPPGDHGRHRPAFRGRQTDADLCRPGRRWARPSAS
jgi:hypothetical protein